MSGTSAVPDILKNVNTIEEQFEADNPSVERIRTPPSSSKKVVQDTDCSLTKAEQSICDNATD